MNNNRKSRKMSLIEKIREILTVKRQVKNVNTKEDFDYEPLNAKPTEAALKEKNAEIFKYINTENFIETKEEQNYYDAGIIFDYEPLQVGEIEIEPAFKYDENKRKRTEKYKAKHKSPVNEKSRRKAESKRTNKQRKIEHERIEKQNQKIRFTRNLKDKNDSIKNKMYKRRSSAKKRVIVGIVGLAAMMLLGGSRTTSSQNNRSENAPIIVAEETNALNTKNVENKIEYEIEETEPIEEIEIEQNEELEEIETEKNKLEEFEEEKNEKVEQSKTEESEAESASTLDKIKVGVRMNIDMGQYWESPDGTGRFGNFAKHNEHGLILSQIDVFLQNGECKVIKNDNNISLKELKQEYPDADFAYGFSDLEGHQLGFLTQNGFTDVLEYENFAVENNLEDDLER